MVIIQMSFILTSKKVFDTVPHKTLICQLDSFNIRKEIVNWI